LPIFEHISLAANPHFQDEFVDCMGFPAHDLTDSISFPGPAA
jgi:hypothetical protein